MIRRIPAPLPAALHDLVPYETGWLARPSSRYSDSREDASRRRRRGRGERGPGQNDDVFAPIDDAGARTILIP